ncbi:hypothetical protein DCCM_2224 [Desulfocucumis palustris]|uniref:Uncharacterized protein n=1 Tax=Desulfocucumis palustris TaxID=1898651 RepID=A0A2L2XA20_9FIRM|nr:hypothetical protein DCCM_2224 [Desulfocucumis palustris]
MAINMKEFNVKPLLLKALHWQVGLNLVPYLYRGVVTQ